MSGPKIFRQLAEVLAHGSPSALAIGNFDGVHRGHQSLLKQTVASAQQRGIVPAALTFDPHPTFVVAPERVPLKLCSLEDRLRLLGAAGAQEVTVLPFTVEISRLSPDAFVEQVLVAALKVRLVLVGENFRFGYQQAGTAETLQSLARKAGFEVCLLSPVLYRNEVVSSSSIRRYLGSTQLSHANRLLGHPFFIEGPVVSGFGIGSKQTVPTLNLRPVPGQITPRGVYVTKTYEMEGDRTWQSITNIGNRPTFAGDEITIETFLLSPFSEPAPLAIRVEFCLFLREERAFPDPQTLRAQIMHDVGRAKAYWRRVESVRGAAPSIY